VPALPAPPVPKEIVMGTLVVVLVVLVVLAVVAAVAWSVMQTRRRAALQDRFGPEYDRAVAQTGDRRAAESQLSELADRRDQLEVRDLDPAARARYDAQWQAVQARFVDEPGQAVADADGLVTAVMRDRGYPVEDFEERASMVATDHADIVEHYRAGHAAHARHTQSGAVDTEDLRGAFVHYRSLYTALISPPVGDGQHRADQTLPGHDADAHADVVDVRDGDVQGTDGWTADPTLSRRELRP
jgi:hypothetical protein